MKKTNLFFVCTMLLSLAFASCSQSDDATMGQTQGETANSQSVHGLTMQRKHHT